MQERHDVELELPLDEVLIELLAAAVPVPRQPHLATHTHHRPGAEQARGVVLLEGPVGRDLMRTIKRPSVDRIEHSVVVGDRVDRQRIDLDAATRHLLNAGLPVEEHGLEDVVAGPTGLDLPGDRGARRDGWGGRSAAARRRWWRG